MRAQPSLSSTLRPAPHRLFRLLLATLPITLLAPLIVTGCGQSVGTECRRICAALCQAGEDCGGSAAGFTWRDPDRETCLEGCDEGCAREEEHSLQCEDGVVLHQDQVDACVDSWDGLGRACRDDANNSALADAASVVLYECQYDYGGTLPWYECR